jgi:hypothetical protein
MLREVEISVKEGEWLTAISEVGLRAARRYPQMMPALSARAVVLEEGGIFEGGFWAWEDTDPRGRGAGISRGREVGSI